MNLDGSYQFTTLILLFVTSQYEFHFCGGKFISLEVSPSLLLRIAKASQVKP